MSGEHVRLSDVIQQDERFRLHRACDHDLFNQELRRHVQSNGVTVYKFECQVCYRRGSAVKKDHKAFATLTSYPPHTNTELYDWHTRNWERRREEAQAEFQQQSDQWRAEYAAYLESPEWFAKRDLVLKRDQNLCQAQCGGCTTRADHVHHLTYKHLFNEPLFDLVAVCRSCHNAVHGYEIVLPSVKAKDAA